ncbi:MAG: enoyl-CoA hydratase/isomerase family protein [Chloroflexi bacterium]|nr:enoyl-CoA hydratase/isomerase family protein [Chloroflexota bacterium]
MAEPVLLYETRENGRIVIMTMNRPQQLNALTTELNNAIVEGWERFAADDNAWVAIITGAGDRSFSAGVDLKETVAVREGRIPPPPPWRPILPPDFTNHWKPTIAAINGYAFAGGFIVAHRCDIRIAAEHAQMGISEARWNMPTGWVHDLTRYIGLGHALELVLWGDTVITAQRAYEMGWVNKVVPKEKLMEEALAWADRMLYLAPRVVRNGKQLLYRGWDMDVMSGRALGRVLDQQLEGMEDSLEGPRAFTEKRRPQFKNR